ncbi:MAG: glycosyltransferase family 2 protein [Lachnospiraceae bacterium]|nr:glycosyltransferase family 2 protein [Candidatus Merdinaster equi]
MDNSKTTQELLDFYKEAYEREKKKNEVLAGKLADAQAKADDAQGKLDHIKNSIFWKISFPFRGFVHVIIRTKDRILRLGSPKGVMRKLRNKMREKKAEKRFGTRSFPSKEEILAQRSEAFKTPVLFSILVPLWNTPEKFLREMIESVINQTCESWELCLADGSDSEHAYVEKICNEYMTKVKARHDQIGAGDDQGPVIRYMRLEKNEGISGNTNQCYKMATGNYIALFDHDDILHPCALYEYRKVIDEKNADYIYCDEATFKNGNINKMITLHFKSDYAVDTLRANNYICHFSAFKRELLEGTELFRSKFDGSQDHDMILRLTDRANCVVHVPKLLYYWRSHKGSVASDISAKTYAIEAARGAVADSLTVHGFKDFSIESTRAFETIFRIRYALTATPKISIVIPNKDHVEDLRRCISSIHEKSTYENYEIVVVENNSTSQEIFDYYDELKKDILHSTKIVTYEGEFNYSKINNLGASKADGEYILLLNNDTEVITVNWMEELLMYAQRQDVGAVGAKLYYEDYTIQHAGIVIGLGAHRTAGHTHYRINKENLGYMGKLCYAQDVTAVTGACLLVKKAVFDEVGGLNENLAIALNDVDFCLKLRAKGYLNVFTPFAELFHYESISRGSDVDESAKKKADEQKALRYNKEAAMFKEIWKDELEKGDPYFNPNFSLDYSDYVVM